MGERTILQLPSEVKPASWRPRRRRADSRRSRRRVPQVSKGRRTLPQTADSGKPALQAIKSYGGEKFLNELVEGRRQAGVLPYTRYAAAIVSAKDSDKARRVADGQARAAGILHDADIRLYGPAQPPFMKLPGRWRWRSLATAPRSRTMQPALRAWCESVNFPGNVRVAIDVDPLMSFL